MVYNECKICGSNSGRAGLLINDACLNCHDTITSGEIVIHANLIRTQEEINKTFNILTNRPNRLGE